MDAPVDARDLLAAPAMIGCGHVSGLEVRPCTCRGPVWRYADQAQIKKASAKLVDLTCFSWPGPVRSVCPYRRGSHGWAGLPTSPRRHLDHSPMRSKAELSLPSFGTLFFTMGERRASAIAALEPGIRHLAELDQRLCHVAERSTQEGHVP